MVAKKWYAMIISVAVVVVAVTTVSAIGNMKGDCLTEQLQDGTGDNCPESTVSITYLEGNMKGDCLLDQLKDGTGDNCTALD